MSLFSRTSTDLPGIQGDVRDGSRGERALRRLGDGDILVIDAPDIPRRTAQEIIDAKAGAVVNASRFTTGAVPNFGPQMLLDAGITLVEGAGPEVFDKIKDGKKGRLNDGVLYYGERRIGAGEPVGADAARASFTEAREGLLTRLEVLGGNLVEFSSTEAPLFVDGLGVPDVDVDMEGRKTLVVAPGDDARRVLGELRNFIKEYEPVLIGVDSGADAIVAAGFTPELIIGDPQGIESATLRSGGRVILPADPDGHARGLERIQDLGVGAMTFPALADSAVDLALVLAAYHGASMIVLAGQPLNLDSLFRDADRPGAPSALLSRLKAGERLVDGSVVADLYKVSGTGFGVAWAILGILVAVAVILVIAGMSGDGTVTENLVDTWNSIALWFQDLTGLGPGSEGA